MKHDEFCGATRAAEVCTLWPLTAAEQMQRITDQCLKADGLLTKIANTSQGESIKAGFAAEVLHAETFNLDAILKDKSVRAFTDRCADTPLSRNNPISDILVMDTRTGEVVQGAQLKYYKNAEATANALRETKGGVAKYKSADTFVVPSDQLDGVKAKAQHTILKNRNTRPEVAEAATLVKEKASGTIQYDGVESQDLSLRDARQVGRGTEEGKGAHRRTQNVYKDRSTQAQTVAAMKSAAIITTVIAGTISSLDCLAKVQKGEMQADEAVKHVLKTTAIAAADSALKAGAAAAAVSIATRRLPEFFMGSVLTSNLSVGSVAGAAICAVDLLECLVLVAAGKMTMAELETRTGKNIFQTGSGVVGASIGAAVGAPAGPIGMAIGSFLGGLITSIATTVAIENHIEAPYREMLRNTENTLRNVQVMKESVNYMLQSQRFYAEFRAGLTASEQQFEQQMKHLNGLGRTLAQRLANI